MEAIFEDERIIVRVKLTLEEFEILRSLAAMCGLSFADTLRKLVREAADASC